MLLTCIKLPFAIKIFVLSIFEWLLITGFTVLIFFHAQTSMKFHLFLNIKTWKNEVFFSCFETLYLSCL